jgi:hypothetical protein
VLQRLPKEAVVPTCKCGPISAAAGWRSGWQSSRGGILQDLEREGWADDVTRLKRDTEVCSRIYYVEMCF